MRARISRTLLVVAITASVIVVGAPTGHAADPGGTITEFAAPGTSVVVTLGADGNLWYSDINGSILRVTTSGAVTQFPTPTSGTSVVGITTGSDGNVWFAELNQSKVGRITPSGVITEFPLPASAPQPAFDVSLGPDGNVWAIAGEEFVKVEPDGTTTGYPGVPGSGTVSMAAGPDGKLWFLEQGANKVGRMTTAGVIDAEFPIPTASSSAGTITHGPDGKLWFTETAAHKIASVTTDGQFTEYPTSAACPPGGIAPSDDGRLWVTCAGTPTAIGVMTPAGAFTEFPTPTANSQPTGITGGPDGNMWFAEFGARQVAKIGTGPVAPPASSAAPPTALAAAPTFAG
jgi:streptogramin lyase